jgi:GMP synthase-like glutamine amidotransferase
MGFHQIFTSDYCGIQGMAHDQWPIVTLQSHPEITALLKKSSADASDWEHVNEERLNAHAGPGILARFIDWVKEH